MPVAAVLALQMPPVQSWAVEKATHALSAGLRKEVSVEKVYFVFFKRLILKNVQILSTPSDTLVHVRKLSMTFSHINPFSHKMLLQKVLLDGGAVHWKTEMREDAVREKDTLVSPWNISLKELTLKNFRFTLTHEERSRHGAFPDVIDFADLDVQNIYIEATDLRFVRDTLYGTLKHLSAVEKSGYSLNQVTGAVSVSGSGVRVRNVSIQDAWSDIRATDFYMHYNSARDFKNFVDSVRLEADFSHALLSFRSLSCYAPALENNHLAAYLTGHVEGPVRYLTGNGFNIQSTSGETSMDVDFRIKGLPNSLLTTAFVDIHQCTSRAGDAAHIISLVNGSQPVPIERFIPPATLLHLNGRLAGLLTNFVADGILTTDVGELSFDAILFKEKGVGFHINGSLGAHEFNLKNIMGEPFGALSMHTHTHLVVHQNKEEGLSAKIDSLRIEKVVVNRYPFSRIFAVGDYKQHRFDGRVVCSDPNLNFIFQGLANLNYKEFQPDQTARYDFHADIAYADLAATGIDHRDSISRFSGSLRANFQRSLLGDVVGSITVQNVGYTNSLGMYKIGNMNIDSHVQDSLYRFELTAPFAKALYTGSNGITTFVKHLRHRTLSRYLPHYFTSALDPSPAQPYRLDMTIYDMSAIGQLALPGLYIAPQTHLTATLTASDSLYCTLRSKYVRYQDQKANNLTLDVTGDTTALRARFSATRLEALSQLVDTVSLTFEAAQNAIASRLDYVNYTGENSGGAVNARMVFMEKEQDGEASIAVHINPSHFIVNKATWELDSARLFFTPKNIYMDRLRLHNQAQSLTVTGSLAKERADTLWVALDQFDFSFVNLFMTKRPYRFSGLVSGNAQVVDFYRERQLSMDLACANIHANEMEVGDVSMNCTWDHEAQSFLIDAKNRLRAETPLHITGLYHPPTKYLHLNSTLQNLSVAYFEPFLSKLVSNLKGTVSGTMTLNGALPNLSFTDSSHVAANNVAFTVNYTKVPYTLNGHVSLHENGFTVQNGRLSDSYGNKGIVNGGMKYQFFRDLSVDAEVAFTNLLCLSTKEKDNPFFYGDAFATGRLHAFGNLTQMMLDIRAKTEKNTAIHIPIAQATEAKESVLLSFVAPENKPMTSISDPLLDSIANREKAKEPTRVSVALNADITPDAQLFIEFNKATGDVLRGVGSGAIAIGVDPEKNLFTVFGDCTISGGDYRILTKNFFISPGGKITFNGDILKTNLDLTAVYRTKASVNTLLSDNNAIANLRDVECRVHMTENMMNPKLRFAIEVADLAPESRSRVQAALATEDKMIRQFMAILVSGSFIPDQQFGIINNTSILYSNATEILSNQLNNIFGYLNLPVDVGFNYQPTDDGRDIFDVAISTQLFNNRVVVNGNIGNAQASGTTGDIAGNIDIEVKLSEKGNFRIKAFSRAADPYSYYSDLDKTQRSGAGITYQEEFNTFRELVNRIFGRRRRGKTVR